MRIKRTISLSIGIVGFFMILSFLTNNPVTGAVVGTNPTSKYLGMLGIFLIIIAVIIEKSEEKEYR